MDAEKPMRMNDRIDSVQKCEGKNQRTNKRTIISKPHMRKRKSHQPNGQTNDEEKKKDAMKIQYKCIEGSQSKELLMPYV